MRKFLFGEIHHIGRFPFQRRFVVSEGFLYGEGFIWEDS